MSKPAGERIVKPRKRTTNADRPIIAASYIHGSYITEQGEFGTLDELFTILRKTPVSLLVCDHSAEFLAKMHARWEFDPDWQFGVIPIQRELFMPKIRAGHRVAMRATAVNFLGWREAKKGRNKTTRTHYHLCIDPITFSSYPLAQAGEEHKLDVLLAWGKQLREFCVSEGINLKPTQGGTARQFLKDDRYYPEPRRKVPRATNDHVREYLPGNYYEVRADPNYQYHATYIDQTKAHHYHALNTPLPDANSLYGYGAFRDLGKTWRAPRRQRVESFLNGFHGLIFGNLYYTPKPFRWIPEYLNRLAQPQAWYTCELDLLRSLGVIPVDIIGAWGSYDVDHGIPAYAAASLDSLADNPPMWEKTLRLSTYGALATRPRAAEMGFAKATRGTPRVIPAGKEKFTAQMLTPRRMGEPSTNNVLHRGLIEAATRTESLMFANYLQQHNHRVLCIYVDAVMVECNGRELPLVPDPWRVKTKLTNLQFISGNAFQSDEMTKIPGGQARSDALKYSPRVMGENPKRVRYNVSNPHRRPHKRESYRPSKPLQNRAKRSPRPEA